MLIHAAVAVYIIICGIGFISCLQKNMSGASGSIERIKRKIYTCSIKYQYMTVTGIVHKMIRCITLPVVFDAGCAEDLPLASSRSVMKIHNYSLL